ncbi:hypothetical protein BCR37DRAFT_397687 [Protomyces lactucae-debilis]|uniref:Uncharacterized protein n=1 Tax=Protomyces lactucae-debilis TaxID=2754530 RepID=A0A1Y2FJZ6_PROLT|nr:uncharacterized protein BCR37DRAFT_397687 [Protomyces lactucae-debilis]ORY84288.1 hypothetical protein BCR37DRAFT_397687 [Protomyces lactucae-debilis]
MDSYHLDYMSLAMRTFSDRTLLAIFIWLVVANWSLAQDMCRQIAMRATKTFESPYCGTLADRAKFCAQGCSHRIADYIYRLAWCPADECSFVNPAFEWDLRFQRFHSTEALPGRLGLAGEGCSHSPGTRIVCMCSVDVMLQRISRHVQVRQQPEGGNPMQEPMANSPARCSPAIVAIRMNPIEGSFENWYGSMVPSERPWQVRSMTKQSTDINCDAAFSSAFADRLIEPGSGSCTIKRPDLSNEASGTLGIKCFGGPGMDDIVDRLRQLYEADPRAQAQNFIRLRNEYALIAGEVYLEIGLGQDFAFVAGLQMGNHLAGYSVLAPEVLAYLEEHYR